MTLAQLQVHLKQTGRYSGAIDGYWGELTRAAILLMMTDGPDTVLTDDDLSAAALRLGATFAQVKAVATVESAGAGFFEGKPKILPEPHRFSKNTGHRFDAAYPSVSYPAWDPARYPKTQDGRYVQLLQMIKLDVDAGFKSASYGKFQILGENYQACGYLLPALYAEAMARDEATQLRAFESFLRVTGLVDELRLCTLEPETCRPFCRGYNGTAYEKNSYHEKIAAAIRRYAT